jgi:hypothetical protein
MNQDKPKLLPVQVPWMVALSAPFLKYHLSDDGQLDSVTFVGYFKLDDVRKPDAPVQVASEPGDFHPATKDEQHPYRLIRIRFSGGREVRARPALSDREVIEESQYDWSVVPGALRPGEDTVANIERSDRFWLETGTSSDPGVYEVEGSPWLKDLGERGEGLHHYMILGRDDYIEVLAEGWAWQAGQAVS